jgi:hypothetical protein
MVPPSFRGRGHSTPPSSKGNLWVLWGGDFEKGGGGGGRGESL